MVEFVEFVRIPKDRIGVLIGDKGCIKKEIEKRANVEIKLDSETGEVTIEKRGELEDPLLPWIARDVVKAIGRGFSPERAFKLFEPGELLRIIDLTEFGESPRSIIRRKGRIIGRNGRTRELIEELTGCYISVHGKTVSIIGNQDQIQDAEHAIRSLCTGAPHGAVYRFLERQRRRKNRHEKPYLWVQGEET